MNGDHTNFNGWRVWMAPGTNGPAVFQALELFPGGFPNLGGKGADSSRLWKIHGGGRADIYGVEQGGKKWCVKFFHDRRILTRIRTALGFSKGRRAYQHGLRTAGLVASVPQIFAYAERVFGCSLLIMELLEDAQQMNLLLKDMHKQGIDLKVDAFFSQLMGQLGRFTADLHNQGISHHDYSPRNVLVVKKNNDVYLMLIDPEDLHFSCNQRLHRHEICHFESRLRRFVDPDAFDRQIGFFRKAYAANLRWNLLVTRLQNIGDMLVFIPAVRALKRSLPHARITLLAKHAGGIEVMNGCPYVDDIIRVQNSGLREKFRLIREFRKRHLDYFIISPQDRGRVPWALMGGARKIAAYREIYNYGEWKSEKLCARIDIAPDYRTDSTEVENCLLLVERVLEDMGADLVDPDLKQLEFSWLSVEEREGAGRILSSRNLEEGGYVVSAPFSKRYAKNWPQDRFVELFSRIHEVRGVAVVLLGGRAERPMIDELKKRLGDWCVVLAGETSLKESAEIVRRSLFMVGPDSGPAFIGSAVGVPVVAFYGPADFSRWTLPITRAQRINIFHDRDCNPCKHQECPLPTSCMDEILLDEVWQAVKEVGSVCGRASSSDKSAGE